MILWKCPSLLLCIKVPSCPRIAQFHGIRDFLLLKSDARNITSETQAKILLSSVTMALHATGWLDNLYVNQI